MKRGLLICLYLLLNYAVEAQESTFRKFYKVTDTSIKSVRCFDGRQCLDGGYMLTGIANFGTPERPFLIKLNCKGEYQWAKNFSVSGSWDNIYERVINTSDSGIAMVHCIGNFQAYNILVAKYDYKGNNKWRKVINNGGGNDMGQGIRQTKDGGFIICGRTNSYGSETVASSFTDGYLAKLTAAGNLEWGRAIGNPNGIDDIKDVIQTKDGNYAFTGSFLDKGCFNIALGKLDTLGNLLWFKLYGDTLSRNAGFALAEDSLGDLYVFGTTSCHNPSPSFNSDLSHFLMRADANGDSIWIRVFNGGPNNGSDNSLSLCIDGQGRLMCGTETMSYPSTGFTPNKQVSHLFNRNGSLIQSLGYNTTGSQYTRIHTTLDGGFTLSGFGTIGSPTQQRANFYKLDKDGKYNCNENDLTNLTVFNNYSIKKWSITPSVANGGIIANNTFEANWIINDTVLCQSFPTLDSTFTVKDFCKDAATQFAASEMGGVSYTWILGNGDTIVRNTELLQYTYTNTGSYIVTLIVTNGCDTVKSSKTITINGVNNFNIVADITNPKEGQPVVLSTLPTATNYTWSTGNTTPTTTVYTSGIYSVVATINGCPATDTIQITFAPKEEGWVAIPNSITPNGDPINSDLRILINGPYQFKNIRIFNRWGEKVFESNDLNNRFNGKVKNENISTETFYYLAEFSLNGERVIYKGDITVIR